jgi:hypothetical protein
MCTSGTTAAIHKAYDTIWGAGIALNLNQEANSPDKGVIGALPHALKGFSFTLSGTGLPNELRINFPMESTAKTAHFRKLLPPKADAYTVLFTEAGQGDWVTGTAKVDLVTTDINSIQFQIVADEENPKAFDFCVENLTALY